MIEDEGWTPVPLALATDLDHGGRWWALTAGNREWLWTNPDAAVAARRLQVRPGDSFVDAGGAEECFPCVRGNPDHGDAWTRSWDGSRPTARVETDFGAVSRTLTERNGTLHLDYLLEPNEAAGQRADGSPTAPVTGAVHLLLELSEAAQLVLPGAGPMLVLDQPAVGEATEAAWPMFGETDVSQFGAVDGTATCAILRGLAGPEAPAEAYLLDGDAMLHLRWQADDPAAVGLMLWRNLGGWPEDEPYRSIGVEPLVEAPGAWWLEISAYARE